MPTAPTCGNFHPELLLSLAYSGRTVTLPALGQALELDGAVLEDALDRLLEAGHMQKSSAPADGFILQAKQRNLLIEMAEQQLATSGNSATGLEIVESAVEEEDTAVWSATWRHWKQAASISSGEDMAKGLKLICLKQYFEGCRLLCRAGDIMLFKDRSAGVLLCLDILLRVLEQWQEHLPSVKEKRRFLIIARQAVGISLYFSKRFYAVKDLLPKFLLVADELGDTRAAVQLKLMHTSHEYLVGGKSASDPQRVMEGVIQEIEALGDPDILSCTVYGIAMQHYARGDYTRALESLHAHHEDSLEEFVIYFGGIDLLVTIPPASSLGRFNLALGCLGGHLKRLDLVGAEYAKMRTRTLGADLLLRAGFPEEALAMMRAIPRQYDPSLETRLAIWTLRNHAYYHFQQKAYARSHELLQQALAVAHKYSITRPYFGFSEGLDMLWVFTQQGFKNTSRLPEYYGLEWLLHYALEKASPQWQGIALRIRAQQLLKRGGKRETAAISWLKDSLQRLRHTGNPIESARTALILAQSLRPLGFAEEADELETKANKALGLHRQYDAPARIRKAPDGEEAVKRCSRFFAALPPWLNLKSHICHLADSLQESLQVERVGCFSHNGGGRFRFLGGRNFFKEEREHESFSVHHERMAQCLQQNRIILQQDPDGAWLHMPIALEGNEDCVLLLHCAYLTENISGQSESSLEEIQRLIKTELRLSFRLQQNIEARDRETLRKSKLAASRLAGDSRLYFGPAMQEALLTADKAAPTEAPVLLLGETGVGKEELARYIHDASNRSGPFVAVHAASIPEQLFESELFGHEKGAFTGAHKQKIGLLELADKGTLFIDEVGDIPLVLQIKLLRVLQDRTFMRVGGTREIHSDFRLMSATNQDLEKKIQEGAFRKDLYYRMAVVPLRIPPLRDRPEDIERLSELFFARYAAMYQRSIPP